jgi:hypothetical protein
MPHEEQRPRAQMRHARAEVGSKVAHGLLPWAAWGLMSLVFGPLRYLLPGWSWLMAGMVLFLGLGLAGFVFHLHGTRLSVAGRAAGGTTALLGSAVTAAWLLAGFSVPIAIVWTFGGAAVCLAWDAWLHAAGSHEPALAFGRATEIAWGAAAKLTADRRPRQGGAAAGPDAPRRSRASRGRGTVTGRVQLPPEVGTEGAAAAVARVEQGLQFPPGSVSLTPDAGNSAFAGYTATDPRVLAEPSPWPGPSAPGTGMSVPFRYGLFQDGTPVLIRRLPVFHTQAMGMSGSAKTMGFTYNQLGEGVTREGYAAFVIDISKGSQFYGAWRGALHGFETEPAGALALLAGFHRARAARAEFMARSHLTEWRDGCGLSFLDIFLAEAPDVLRLLPTGRRAQQAGEFTREDWESDVKTFRSVGGDWNMDLQLALDREMTSVAQAQLSHLCLGVETPEDARFGLSSRQRRAGCSPERWGARQPGMAYWDAPTLDEAHGVMPLRFSHWEGGARQAFEYAEAWPAMDRPLDDVTAGALAWTPPVSPSGSTGAEFARPGSAAAPGARAGARGNLIPLFGPPRPDQHEEMVRAEQVARDQMAAWLAQGKATFTSLELQKAGVHEKAGRSRSWLYDVIATLEQTGEIQFMTDKPKKRWRIVPPPAAVAEDEEGG